MRAEAGSPGSAVLAVVLALAACGVADPDLYRQAGDAPPAEAVEACRSISATALRDECLALTAASAAAAGVDSRAWCREATAAVWREECAFLVVDELQLVGPEAVEACGGAGRFAPDCLHHALARDVARAALPTDVGSERALLRAIQEIVDRYRDQQPRPARTAEAFAARRIGLRWGRGPFSPDQCGEAAPSLCATAYRYSTAVLVEPGRIEALCAGGVDLEEAIAAGAPGWTPAGAPIAEAGWRQACDLAAARAAWSGPGPAPGEVIPLRETRWGLDLGPPP